MAVHSVFTINGVQVLKTLWSGPHGEKVCVNTSVFFFWSANTVSWIPLLITAPSRNPSTMSAAFVRFGSSTLPASVCYGHVHLFWFLSPPHVIAGVLPDCVSLFYVNSLTSSLAAKSYHASPSLVFLVSVFPDFYSHFFYGLRMWIILVCWCFLLYWPALWTSAVFLLFSTILLSIRTCYPGSLVLH